MKISYGWIVVGIGALMTCIGMGAMMSLAVFLQPISETTGWSRAGVSATATLNFLCMGFAGFLWGALSDRYGTRVVVVIGAVLLGLGLTLASQATELWQFQILYGVLVGAAAGSFYAPMVAAASVWIEKNRSLAVALVSAGMGVAPLTVAQFAIWLNLAYDWRTAMFTIGVCAAAVLIPAALFVRSPPKPAAAIAGAPRPAASMGAGDVQMTAAQALRTPQFITLALAHFACCACHSGPIFHMVTYARICGIEPVAAVSVYGVAGLAGLGGRIGFGAAADRFGAKQVLVLGLLLQAVSAGTYLAVSHLGEFYALSLVFGLAYGGVMPLYAILVRDFFGEKIMGTMFGAVTMVASFGMAIGPWAGGLVFDTFNGYGWLYIGAASIGLAAAAIALAFPSKRMTPVQPAMA
jgi:MFS family permease